MATAERTSPRRAALIATTVAIFLVLASGATATSPAGRATIVPPAVLTLKQWTASSANRAPVKGVVEWDGKPVSGVTVRVDAYIIPTPTGSNGVFTFLVDDTRMQRLIVTIADASNAEVDGKPLTSAQRSALARTTSAITVAYPISKLSVSRDRAGDPVVSGRIVDGAGLAPPGVGLSTYALTGTVTDANGRPIAGALVSTRTVDRDYWTVSTATDKSGRFSSLFTASDEEGDDPVPMTVRIAAGNTVYQFLPDEFVDFRPLQSATLDLQLPPSGFAMAVPLPRSYSGAIYAGTIVGASRADGSVIRPLSTTWTGNTGDFSMTLPRSFTGKTVSLWEASLDLFSVKRAVPGGSVDLRDWPSVLPADAPSRLLRVRLP